jgi:hypothetical protein
MMNCDGKCLTMVYLLWTHTLRDAICDALCGGNRVLTRSANASPSRKRTWIKKRISEEWENTCIVRDTVESNIASLDDMKREVDKLLRRYFSRVGEKLRPKKFT